MNLSLTKNLENFIRERVVSGDYNKAIEVVREAIRLLIRTEEENSLRMDRLRSTFSMGD